MPYMGVGILFSGFGGIEKRCMCLGKNAYYEHHYIVSITNIKFIIPLFVLFFLAIMSFFPDLLVSHLIRSDFTRPITIHAHIRYKAQRNPWQTKRISMLFYSLPHNTQSGPFCSIITIRPQVNTSEDA